MWKHLLVLVALIVACLAACETQPTFTGDPPSLEDASAPAAAPGDATAPLSADGGVKKKDGGVGEGTCKGAFDNKACALDGDDGICCGGVCVSRYEKEHCRRCSEKCEDKEACGLTGCLGTQCKPGRASCYTADGNIGGCCGEAQCTDLQTSALHCGKCGHACDPGFGCINGSCVLADCTGAPGGARCLGQGSFFGECCGGVCKDVNAEANHCGACGAACPIGVTCSNAQCKGDAGGPVWCSVASSPPCPSGTTCSAHTGRCEQTACNGAAEEGYACALGGSARGACCSGGCVDLRSDANHCGTCGVTCGAGEWCNAGYCQAKVTCGIGNSGVACNLSSGKSGTCCDGACIETLSVDSCGQCGAGCKSGSTCRADGICADAKGAAVFCTDSTQCPAGRTCNAGRCLRATCAPGANGGACAFGRTSRGTFGTCCNGACVDLNQDKDSCGTCGNACASGLCAGGQCMPTPHACPAGGCFGGQQCVDGTCVAACQAGPMGGFCAATSGGLGACCDNFFSSSCQDLKGDANNCGGCGVRCPTGQSCQGGKCSGASGICTDGHQGAYCDAAGGESKLCCGGACVDVDTDEFNCGSCGKTCGSGESCIDGACAVTSCAGVTNQRACRVGAVFGVCCGGACVDTKSDETHCGQCNKGCGSGAECRLSRCAVPTCAPASAGAPCFLAGDAVGRCCGAGACVDITKDPKNCLGCGIACGPTQSCANGCQ